MSEEEWYVRKDQRELRKKASQEEIFSEDDISLGPVARIRLPERICAGTHSYWADASQLRMG